MAQLRGVTESYKLMTSARLLLGYRVRPRVKPGTRAESLLLVNLQL
jgi:hypothetical protein